MKKFYMSFGLRGEPLKHIKALLSYHRPAHLPGNLVCTAFNTSEFAAKTCLILVDVLKYILVMSVVNISSKVTKGEDLVILSKKEYEMLSELKKIYEFAPTAAQKKALTKARDNRARGKVLTLNEIKSKLATDS